MKYLGCSPSRSLFSPYLLGKEKATHWLNYAAGRPIFLVPHDFATVLLRTDNYLPPSNTPNRVIISALHIYPVSDYLPTSLGR